jgi:hypothetical protein
MATRRRPSNPTGEHPIGQPVRRGEEFDVEERGWLSDVRIFVVMEQTVQLREYHPVSARLGMEATIPDNNSPARDEQCFQMLEARVSNRLREVIREKVAQGLEVLN